MTRKTGSTSQIRLDIVEAIKKMLDTHNPHVKAFRTARDRFSNSGYNNNLQLVLASERTTDGRTHNLPTEKDVAALIPGDFSMTFEKRIL